MICIKLSFALFILGEEYRSLLILFLVVLIIVLG